MSNAANNTPPKTPTHSGSIFAALRRMNGVVNATNDELDAIVSSGERLAGWCALLIVAALVAEAILVFVPLTPLLAKIDAFIVDFLIAVGVFGELFFHKRSSHAQGELQRRAGIYVAEVNARADEANARALKATLELAKFRSPRVLTGEQWARIVEKMRGFPGTKFSGAVNRADSEFIDFISELTFCLIDAGWIGTDWHDPTSRMQSKFPSHLPKIGVGIRLDDVVVTVPMDNQASADGARALVVMLMAEGIAAAPALSTGKDVSIIVGPKR